MNKKYMQFAGALIAINLAMFFTATFFANDEDGSPVQTASNALAVPATAPAAQPPHP